ncbi:dolichyl-diphosphooligosaccharide--protein glycosyltransferase subunit DAD1-like [Rutidosis leptorrhynchoides]|uniref:dolichyl-diphosphooligosaccharide--protein glycosyltransferase subunit DAD1-like n=1 Tax=Rutidosis leptorrhynchoides TaxID=125765 RepID=UPI003A99FA85
MFRRSECGRLIAFGVEVAPPLASFLCSKIIDLYVVFAVSTALIQVAYMAIVGSFPFNSFFSGVLSCVGTAVLAVCLRIQVNKENKEFKDLPPERAFANFVLCNLVLHLVIMNFLG